MSRRAELETAEQRFERLYHDTSDDVLAYLLRRSETPDDAADAFAETYAVSWRKLAQIPHGHHARLWLFGVARIELRKTAGRARAHDDLVDQLSRELQIAATEVGSSVEIDDDLILALSRLSDQDRDILTLHAWEDLPPRSIATVMGMSANVVRVRLHRARRELRACLAQEQPIEDHADPVAPGG